MKFRATIIFALIAIASLPGFGANLITNGGFELPSIGPNNGIATTSLTGWMIHQTSGTPTTVLASNIYLEGVIGNPDVLSFQTPYGLQHADVTGPGWTAGAGISQDILVEAGKQYKVTFALGNMGLDASAAYCLDPFVNGSCPTTPVNYYSEAARIELVVGGVSQGFFTNANTAGGGRAVDWQTITAYFTAGATGTVNIRFNAATKADNYVGLDNVSVDMVPEPGTVLMMGCGLIALGMMRKRYTRN
jgi:hypothetical protein